MPQPACAAIRPPSPPRLPPKASGWRRSWQPGPASRAWPEPPPVPSQDGHRGRAGARHSGVEAGFVDDFRVVVPARDALNGNDGLPVLNQAAQGLGRVALFQHREPIGGVEPGLALLGLDQRDQMALATRPLTSLVPSGLASRRFAGTSFPVHQWRPSSPTGKVSTKPHPDRLLMVFTPCIE